MSINTQMKALIAKSKEGKLLPEEYAVFTLYEFLFDSLAVWLWVT